MSKPVQIPPLDPDFTDTVGPMQVSRRTKAVGLTELGAGYAVFTEAGTLGPEPLPYEEMLYILEGKMTVTFDDDEVVAGPGEMLVLRKGTVASFTAPQGTRLVYSLVPQDWRERGEADLS